MVEEFDSPIKFAHQQARVANIRRRSVTKPSLVGNYRMGKKLGSGAYGTVYEAFKEGSTEKFAAKVIYFNENNYKNVKNQVRICQQLNHENIAKVYEVIEEQNKIYIIMEFCENGELFEFVKTKGPMKEDLASKIFIQIHSAVKYLHLNKIAHRDIKTENVLLDSNMNAKLIDFGFSKEYQAQDPMMDTFCGSPSYVSPQIIKKQKYNGEKVDVWSLGITLYIMLEAAEPFFAQSNNDTKFRIVNYQWSTPRYSSSQARQLYELIFVPASCRITLSQMQNSAYFQKYYQVSAQKIRRMESRSTQKTERLSTGQAVMDSTLPEIAVTQRKKQKFESLKHAMQTEGKQSETSMRFTVRASTRRFTKKERSADLKAPRSIDFRVKVTPSKIQKLSTEQNVQFFKRDIISSLNQY